MIIQTNKQKPERIYEMGKKKKQESSQQSV